AGSMTSAVTTCSRPPRSGTAAGSLTASRAGSRTTTVTSCPAAIACSVRHRPVPPVAPKIVSFMAFAFRSSGTLVSVTHTIRKPYHMKSISSADPGAARRRRRLNRAIKESLRDMSIQLALLNHRVGGHLELKGTDLECLDL